MTKSATETGAADHAASKTESHGFLRDWVLPVVLGLLIGGGLVGGWKYGKVLFQSKAAAIVQKLSDEDVETETIAKELRALGPSARDDVVKAMIDLPASHTDEKTWVAQLLAGEPWFATATLKEIVANTRATAADRRAAAAGLVDAQAKEVDTELVLPVFVEWLGDASATDRGLAVGRVVGMWRTGMLNARWETAVKRALMELSKRGPKAKNPEEAALLDDDRAAALHGLSVAVTTDEDVKKLEWSVAKDDTDSTSPRIGAIRALAEADVLGADTVEDWLAVSKSRDGAVRQTVADNLSKTRLPEFDKVIEPLQFDESQLARSGALDTQIQRRRPTMLARFDELAEDSYEWVAFYAMVAAGMLKSETDGLGARAGLMLRVVESSDDEVRVKGAVLGLRYLTDIAPGFQGTDLQLNTQDVDETALKTFMADKAGRKDAAAKWREKIGPAAVWTDADRKATFEKLLKHADPENVARARRELEKM